MLNTNSVQCERRSVLAYWQSILDSQRIQVLQTLRCKLFNGWALAIETICDALAWKFYICLAKIEFLFLLDGLNRAFRKANASLALGRQLALPSINHISSVRFVNTKKLTSVHIEKRTLSDLRTVICCAATCCNLRTTKIYGRSAKTTDGHGRPLMERLKFIC